jgi:DNA-binding NarL/FixJ family response regulator
VWGHAALAVVAVHRGDFGEALAAASAVEEHAQRQPILTFPAQARLVRAFAALSRGDGRTARAESLEARRQLDGIGIVEPGMPFLHWNHVDALLLAGDRSGAEEEVERLTEIAERTGYSFTRAIAARARGALLTLDGSVDAAVAQFDEALREHERSGWPFERARTLLAAGVALRRGKQKRLARERLQEAADVFAELGTAVWAERAAAELQRVGGRHASAPGALTASEQRVAELVVEGLTNDEVAGRLHLSTKTVAAHLTSVYAKLGVRSRTELARQLSSTG